jgi:hypothetical protein
VSLYLTTQRGVFLVGLLLYERAAHSAEAGSSPPLGFAVLTAAPKYAEGRGLRLHVTSHATLEAVRALIPFKRLAALSRVSRKSVAKEGRA